jgi:5-formyltetrahydrofolate cyclo-ligase
MNIQEIKHTLRQRLGEELKQMAMARRAAASTQACSLLRRQAVWQRAEAILFYAPMPEELDVWPLLNDALALGRTVALPRFDPAERKYLAAVVRATADDVQVGRFGIREPGPDCGLFAFGRFDLVLVPGVAFDVRGGRLGHGRGYYDQMLPLVRGMTCGVAFDEQVVDEVPVGPKDVRVRSLVTPTRWVEAGWS